MPFNQTQWNPDQAKILQATVAACEPTPKVSSLPPDPARHQGNRATLPQPINPMLSLLPPRLDCCDRDQWQQYFHNTWELETWLLATIVGPDPWYQQPDPLRNPLIFYRGHCASFYINKLHQVGLVEPVEPALEALFALGVDPRTPAELQTTLTGIPWPSLAAVDDYRQRVHEVVLGAIDRAPWSHPITPDDPLWALVMGLEHSRVHLETTSVLLRQLPLDQVQRPPDWNYAPLGRVASPSTPSPLGESWQELAGGLVTLGKSHRSPYYGWDMEYGYQTLEVAPFQVSTHLVTQGEFLAFVADGGYGNRDWWDEDSWAWVQGDDRRPGEPPRTHPQFWIPHPDGSYGYRALFDELPLALDWPVEVNHHEALAFCRWRGDGVRLLTEAEWTWATAADMPQGPDAWDYEAFNLNLLYGSPTAVGQVRSAKSPTGLYDLRGNVWEWLGDRFHSLPGFQPHPLYPDHAAPYCHGDHSMMVGGSWITNGTMAAPTYRNWFRPHFYQHAGFRLARSAMA